MVLNLSVDLLKAVPSSCNETGAPLPVDEDGLISIKVEVTDVQEEGDPVPKSCSVKKGEHEMS
jgi:hypothetical protein